MTGVGEFETTLDASRERVSHPVRRLFRTYGLGKGRWLVIGLLSSVFAHGVVCAILTDAYETVQRLDMTFFDDEETGEIVLILNNDTRNREVLFDNALGEGVRIGVTVVEGTV